MFDVFSDLVMTSNGLFIDLTSVNTKYINVGSCGWVGRVFQCSGWDGQCFF